MRRADAGAPGLGGRYLTGAPALRSFFGLLALALAHCDSARGEVPLCWCWTGKKLECELLLHSARCSKTVCSVIGQ